VDSNRDTAIAGSHPRKPANQQTDVDHVTLNDDHVMSENDHVMSGNDHMMSENVTSKDDHLIARDTNLTADNSLNDDQTSLYTAFVMTKTSQCCTTDRLDLVCDPIQYTDITHDSSYDSIVMADDANRLQTMSEKTL
jgi:hypothetical protein